MFFLTENMEKEFDLPSRPLAAVDRLHRPAALWRTVSSSAGCPSAAVAPPEPRPSPSSPPQIKTKVIKIQPFNKFKCKTFFGFECFF